MAGLTVDIHDQGSIRIHRAGGGYSGLLTAPDQRQAAAEVAETGQKVRRFADRTSCQHGWPNQFRLLLASLAYTLIETIRRIGLKGTALARADVGTIRLKLFKIGAVILSNTRRVRFLLSRTCPDRDPYSLVARRLAGG